MFKPSLDDVEEVDVGLDAVADAAASDALPQPEAQPQQSAEASELPSGLKDALAALRKAEAMPHATKEQKVKREVELARIRPHVARLQEGVPTPTVTAQALGSYHHKLVSNARRERLEFLARSSPEIAELLAERDALTAAVEKLKKP